MDTNPLFIVIAVLLDGVAGLSGGLLPHKFVHRHLASLLAFAAGTLLSVAFLDLIPEALEASTSPLLVGATAMAGFVLFHLIQRLLGGHAAGQSGHKHAVIGPMILIGDAMHNMTDGVAIAAAFMTDVKVGIAATIAVVVHELPQEIGDFAILVAHGYSKAKALFLNMLVQLSALIGAFGALAAAKTTEELLPYIMALSAGGFAYIAAADLLPALRRHTHAGERRWTKVIAFIGGVAAIIVIENIL